MPIRSATSEQINYMEILFNDLQFDRRQRNAWLSDRFSREIKALDEITVGEAMVVIDNLKEVKENEKYKDPN